MMAELEENVREAGIEFSDPTTGDQGIVHVIGPEQGITQPGKTIVCGDSHTSTHGAFGALAFGIGTSQIRDVLATGTVAMEKQKVRKIQIDGELGDGVVSEGRHPRDHSPTRHRGRRRLRLRVRRRGHREPRNGRADVDL